MKNVMHNPANNNCPRNADPRNESCACGMERELDLTPDFRQMFQQMMREAQAQAVVWRNDMVSREQPVDAATPEDLRSIQRWFWPLAMAANTMTSLVEITQFRTLMTEILTDIDRAAAEVEAKVADVEEV